MPTQRSSPAIRTRSARRAAASSAGHCTGTPRSASSASVRSPTTRSSSTTSSASRGRRWSVRQRSCRSVSASTAGSSSSRRSTRPSNSPSRVGSSASAAARRSANGASPVEERPDIAEEQRPGERRGAFARHLDQADLPAGQVAHQPGQGGLVEDVLQALPGGLQGDREVGVLAGHVEQLGGALALLPQWLPAARVTPGQQQRPGGALAEPGGEERRGAHRLLDQLGDLVGLEDHQLGAGRFLGGVRQPHHDAVVGGHDLGVHPVAFGQPAADGQRPRPVDPGPEHTVHGEPPVTQLVAEPLDQHRPVVGQRAGGGLLLPQVRHQVAGRPVVQTAGAQRGQGGVVVEAQQRPDPGTDGPPQLDRTAQLVALPERHPGRLAGSGGDQHPVGGDLLDPPGRRAEQEDVADPGLVDHLLVELADPGGALGPGQEDPEQSPVGDGATAGDGEALGTRPAGQHVGGPVPDQPGTQLGEGGRRVAAGEHVEHGVQRRVGQLGEGCGPADQHRQVAERPRFEGDHGDDLLGEHVERVARIVQLLDGTGRHPLRDHGAGEQVAPVLGKDHPRDTAPTWCPARPTRCRPAATLGGPRSAPPGRPPPCRCRAPGWRWPPRRAAGRT